MADTTAQEAPTKSQERRVFIFLAVFLAPAIAVAVVVGYGFSVWFLQMLTGPPTG